jgi:DNA-binding transcriptional MerR regulator
MADYKAKGGDNRMDYSIGEAAKLLDVSPQAIRSWEKRGLTPLPRRRPTNMRRYTEADMQAIKNYLNKRNK